MKRLLRHIIEEYINAMPLTFPVISATYDGVNTTVVVDNTLHLSNRCVVDGFQVIEVVDSNTFILKGEFTGITVTYPRPYYFAGTPLSVVNELTTRRRSEDKYPFIYLYEVIEEQFNNTNRTRIERTCDVRLYFLDECTYKWDSEFNMEKYYEQVVDGMFRLANYFVENASNSDMFGEIERYSIKSYAKFGAFKSVEIKNNLFKNSMDNTVFNEELSGIELRLTLPVYQEKEC